MKRLILAYALCSYALFGLVFVWLAAFLWNLGDLRGPATRPTAEAATLNLALIALFGIAHSVMARPAFKRVWTRIIPPAAERATYVLQSSVLLGLILWQWEPIPAIVWQVDGFAVWLIHALSAFGAGTVLISPRSCWAISNSWAFRKPGAIFGARPPGLPRSARRCSTGSCATRCSSVFW